MAKTKVKRSSRKFYRTVFTLEVLSEEAVPHSFNLGEVYQECLMGAYSGDYKRSQSERVSAEKIVQLLTAQGSAPCFFKLTDKAEDIA